MATGIVKLFYPAKRYGFIQQDTGGEDVFVHASTVKMAGLKRLRKGQRVHFEIYDNQGRPAARNLRVQTALVGALEDQSRFEGDEALAENDLRLEISPAKAGGSRKPISRADLEHMLAEAIRTSHPGCEPFVGVIVERTIPASPKEAGWAVKGVKYGNADRSLCGAALSNCLNELQQQFQVVD
jgi:CspA family cold shock protein